MNVSNIRKFLIVFAIVSSAVSAYSQDATDVIEPEVAITDSIVPVSQDSLLSVNAENSNHSNFFQKIGAYFKRSNHFDPSKKIDFGVIGGPFYNSATGFGIGAVASGLYRIDRTDETLPLSNVSIFANVATSGMVAVGVKGNNVFPHERYKLDYTVYFYTFPSKIWGVGYDKGNVKDNETNYSRIKFEAKPRFLFRVFDNAYVGPVVNFQYVKVTDLSQQLVDLVECGDDSFTAVGAGLSLNYDSRDVITNPSRGWFFQLDQLFMPKCFGNDNKFMVTDLTVSTYKRAWKGAIIAGELHSQLNFQDVPWPMMACVGGPNRMRGYYEGRYRDKCIVEAQVELRQHICRRNGIAVWVGAANVFPEFDQIRWKKTLLNAGLGYRWAFKENVNVRLDLGFTKNGIGFAFNINEAF